MDASAGGAGQGTRAEERKLSRSSMLSAQDALMQTHLADALRSTKIFDERRHGNDRGGGHRKQSFNLGAAQNLQMYGAAYDHPGGLEHNKQVSGCDEYGLAINGRPQVWASDDAALRQGGASSTIHPLVPTSPRHIPASPSYSKYGHIDTVNVHDASKRTHADLAETKKLSHFEQDLKTKVTHKNGRTFRMPKAVPTTAQGEPLPRLPISQSFQDTTATQFEMTSMPKRQPRGGKRFKDPSPPSCTGEDKNE